MTDRPRWDYYTLIIEQSCTAAEVEGKLSEVGASGWELVQLIPDWAHGQSVWVAPKLWSLAVFKRPRNIG